MKIVFMGTPDFAKVSLEQILKDGHDVALVLTQPDRPKGRGKNLAMSPVKQLAGIHKIPICQPENLKLELVKQELIKAKPDLCVVVAYGNILPQSILDIPTHGSINLHGSLLPKYRGAAPIQWSIINGETKTGVTTIFMDSGMDTGDIILKTETTIDDEETFGELYNRLAVIGAQLLLKTVDLIDKKMYTREAQDHEQASFAPIITKKDCYIDFNKPAKDIYNLVRGLYPSPLAYTFLGEKRLKIEKCKVNMHYSAKPGVIVNDKQFIVACCDGSVELSVIRPEGKKSMRGDEFMRGLGQSKPNRLN